MEWLVREVSDAEGVLGMGGRRRQMVADVEARECEWETGGEGGREGGRERKLKAFVIVSREGGERVRVCDWKRVNEERRERMWRRSRNKSRIRSTKS